MKQGMKIGIGYDVHRLVPGRSLILGGVQIPYEKGLLGHSDADVLCHAIMDAVLGALCLGDIGQLFPDSDPAYEGACSLDLLAQVASLAQEKGYHVSNLDCIVIAQEPRLSPYIGQMRAKIAGALSCREDVVSVKPTTEEGLGFTGNQEGIAAAASCLMEQTHS